MANTKWVRLKDSALPTRKDISVLIAELQAIQNEHKDEYDIIYVEEDGLVVGRRPYTKEEEKINLEYQKDLEERQERINIEKRSEERKKIVNLLLKDGFIDIAKVIENTYKEIEDKEKEKENRIFYEAREIALKEFEGRMDGSTEVVNAYAKRASEIRGELKNKEIENAN